MTQRRRDCQNHRVHGDHGVFQTTALRVLGDLRGFIRIRTGALAFQDSNSGHWLQTVQKHRITDGDYCQVTQERRDCQNHRVHGDHGVFQTTALRVLGDLRGFIRIRTGALAFQDSNSGHWLQTVQEHRITDGDYCQVTQRRRDCQNHRVHGDHGVFQTTALRVLGDLRGFIRIRTGALAFQDSNSGHWLQTVQEHRITDGDYCQVTQEETRLSKPPSSR